MRFFRCAFVAAAMLSACSAAPASTASADKGSGVPAQRGGGSLTSCSDRRCSTCPIRRAALFIKPMSASPELCRRAGAHLSGGLCHRRRLRLSGAARDRSADEWCGAAHRRIHPRRPVLRQGRRSHGEPSARLYADREGRLGCTCRRGARPVVALSRLPARCRAALRRKPLPRCTRPPRLCWPLLWRPLGRADPDDATGHVQRLRAGQPILLVRPQALAAAGSGPAGQARDDRRGRLHLCRGIRGAAGRRSALPAGGRHGGRQRRLRCDAARADLPGSGCNRRCLPTRITFRSHHAASLGVCCTRLPPRRAGISPAFPFANCPIAR